MRFSPAHAFLRIAIFRHQLARGLFGRTAAYSSRLEADSSANGMPLLLAGLAVGRTLSVIRLFDLSTRFGHDRQFPYVRP
jgi:hypothetical protein